MDLSKYSRKKERNLVTFTKVDKKHFIVSSTIFDKETGDQLDSEIRTINIDTLLEERNKLKKRLDEMDLFLGDVDKVLKANR